MQTLTNTPGAKAELGRADALFRSHMQTIFRGTDRLFAGLLACEWLAGIAVALWVSPSTWAGLESTTHPHVWVALVLGGGIVSLPIFLALTMPGHPVTRHCIAAGQMLYAGLLIHLTGGRLETHFLIFGSLAFLAFYRDWRVLVTASAVTAADHILRELWWPQSVYGLAGTTGWRWAEHAWWVVFEDAFLILSCLRGVAEMRAIAERQARLERDQLESAVRQVSTAAECVAAASQEFTTAAAYLSDGTQEQASALEEVAPTLEAITAAVKQNADNAQQANHLALAARDVAEEGGRVVGSAVVAMGEINQASRRITDIITAIDEIAFQINLLALNAAVEAARAGEQGRGFAVVAAEVRSLAQRSAAAAKEIKGLILDSVGKVEAGSEVVNKAGQTLTGVVGSVRHVTELVAAIAATSGGQAAGILQVSRAVTQMDGLVQRNAAQAEELSSTAQSLAGEAQRLQALVGRVRLTTDRSAGATDGLEIVRRRPLGPRWNGPTAHDPRPVGLGHVPEGPRGGPGSRAAGPAQGKVSAGRQLEGAARNGAAH
jgi:methyl-accepting chemotaxis protein